MEADIPTIQLDFTACQSLADFHQVVQEELSFLPVQGCEYIPPLQTCQVELRGVGTFANRGLREMEQILHLLETLESIQKRFPCVHCKVVTKMKI